MSYAQLFKLLIPELIVLLAGLLLLALDLGVLRNKILVARVRIAAFIACLGLVAAFLWIIGTQTSGRIAVWDGMLVLDQLTSLGKQIVLIVSAIVVIVSVGSRFTSHVGEYFLLLLLATIGMMFLVASENILVIFVSLELLSLSLYIMTAFNKQSLQSAEAALKYFLFGGMSAAFMLFGLSLLFGASGELNLVSIASKLKGAPVDPLVVVAIIMVVVGFGFKIAAVPFHLWAPDTYQAAPLPAATFIASASKVASFFILTKVLLVGFAGAEGSVAGRHWVQGWMPLIATIAAASMVLGNLAAIAQKSVRRLLAYSAIAQAGYILVGVLANDQDAVSSMLYYVTTLRTHHHWRLCRSLCAWRQSRARPAWRAGRIRETRAPALSLHADLPLIARGNSAVSRLLWEILSLRGGFERPRWEASVYYGSSRSHWP